MGDVKVASVAHAVAPMAAVAAAAVVPSIATATVGVAAPVAASEGEEEHAREDEGESVVAQVDSEVKTEVVAAVETAMDVGEKSAEPVEMASTESYVQCNGAAHKTMESAIGSRAHTHTAVVVEPVTAESRVARTREEAQPCTVEGGEANGFGERDAVAAPTRKRPRSRSMGESDPTATVSEPKQEQHDEEDEELAATTSVEEQSPEVICVDGDTLEEDNPDDDDDDGGDTVTSELSAVEETSEALHTQQQQPPPRRRRKRMKVLGFSTNRKNRDAKHRRQVAVVPSAVMEDDAVVAPPTRARRQRSAETLAETATPAQDACASASAGASSNEVVTWDWNTCSVYFDPLTQTSMDELAAVRRANAQLVAANEHLWGQMRGFADETNLASMLSDAGADYVDRLRFRAMSRGRSFRDAWEEEDFVLLQRQPVAAGRGASKKRPFAGCEGVASFRKLVRGYDDDLFSKYVEHLEAAAKRRATSSVEPTGSNDGRERVENSPARRLKCAKRPVQDVETLPPVPCCTLHPASCGSWKLKGKEPVAFDSIHPAAVRAAFVPQRWVEEMAQTTKHVDDASDRPRRTGRGKQDNHDSEGTDEGDNAKCESAVDDHATDELVELPSFGVVVDEDEVSHEIDNSIRRLLELSAVNWRRARAVYERAVAHIEITPLLLREEAIKRRLEKLYRKMYPPALSGQDDSVDEAPLRALQLVSKPKDIVSYAIKPCSDAHEEMAVASSVEYAVRLQRGDAIDVLDRNGCWNDGVVIDLFEEAGVGIKFVLVSFALWGADASEWVSIADGRVLPRGVADGRVTFKVAPSSIRKKRVELNKTLADLLQRTYAMRLAARAQLRIDKQVNAKPSSKKQRRQR